MGDWIEHDFSAGPLEWQYEGFRYVIRKSPGVGAKDLFELRHEDESLGTFATPDAAFACVREIHRKGREAAARILQSSSPERFTLHGVEFVLFSRQTKVDQQGERHEPLVVYQLKRRSQRDELDHLGEFDSVAQALGAAIKFVESLPMASGGIVRPRGVPPPSGTPRSKERSRDRGCFFLFDEVDRFPGGREPKIAREEAALRIGFEALRADRARLAHEDGREDVLGNQPAGGAGPVETARKAPSVRAQARHVEAPRVEALDLHEEPELVRRGIAGAKQRAPRGILWRLGGAPGPGFYGPPADPLRFVAAERADEREREREQDRDEASGHVPDHTEGEIVLELRLGAVLVARIERIPGRVWGSRRWSVQATGALWTPFEAGLYRRERSAWRHAAELLEAFQTGAAVPIGERKRPAAWGLRGVGFLAPEAPAGRRVRLGDEGAPEWPHAR